MQQEQTFTVRADASRADELIALLQAHGFAPATREEEPLHLTVSHLARAVGKGYEAYAGRALERDAAYACAHEVLKAGQPAGLQEALAQAQHLRYALHALQAIAAGVPMAGKYAESAVKHITGPQPAAVHAAPQPDLAQVGRDLEAVPQPYAGAIVLLETIAECGADAFDEQGAATPNRRLCLQFAEQLRAAVTRPIVVGGRPVLSWQQQYEAERVYWGKHDERPYMQSEINALRTALVLCRVRGAPAESELVDEAAEAYLQAMKPKANLVKEGVHLWTGWALADAFKAGRASAYAA